MICDKCEHEIYEDNICTQCENKNNNATERIRFKDDKRTKVSIFLSVCAFLSPLIIWSSIIHLTLSFTAFICIFLLSYILGVSGLVLGLTNRKGPHRGIAITAMVLSIIGLVLTTFLLLGIFMLLYMWSINGG